MKLTNAFFILTIILVQTVKIVNVQNGIEPYNEIMNSTFKIQDLSGRPIGTAFLFAKQSDKNTSSKDYILVTANHVLRGMKGDSAIIFLRKQMKTGGYEKIQQIIEIRNNGNPLWIKHENADVAAINISVPQIDALNLMSPDVLATDETIKQARISTGYQFTCFGYPLGKEANEFGFPMSQNGKLSSRIIPMKQIKIISLKIPIDRGYSGGPVYFEQNSGVKTNQILIGLVSSMLSIKNQENENEDTAIADIVPAAFIKETIDRLKDKN
ncbi:trypsin-like peptidase domain-containing protein [Maribellus sediminis]|uniref:trypsin-like peptidase domain-containing protein n=1 Tax=Maribellus sediminis TaxID=2696285 RepID=UPI0014300853|nr:trypsin-like peptidase domain-containing protein [Maribellus sediminis]